MTNNLAPYACSPATSRGRMYPEEPSRHRDPYQRDRDRIIHSAAFRRLKHKTQVFVAGFGDHFRTRLTHSLEVAQIARALARTLDVNEDLTEAIALAHDLGHPPFAHKGEDALAAHMAPYGGFMHNDQTVRVLTHLEHRYAAFRGLNLTLETLEGLVKHNGPVLKKNNNRVLGPDPRTQDNTGASDQAQGPSIDELPFTVKELSSKADLLLDQWTPLEAQIVDIADDTAYCNHDVEDGLRAECFSLNDLKDLALYADVIPELTARYRDQPADVIRAEIIRHQIGRMVDDILITTRANLAALNPKNVSDIRGAGCALVRFSPPMFAMVKELREFLFTHMYDSPTMTALVTQAESVIGGLFHRLMDNPGLLPPDWQEESPRNQSSLFPPPSGRGEDIRARLIADYIAGMTDGYAISAWERLGG
jgi:dGTPase